jgi:hypothetical protein
MDPHTEPDQVGSAAAGAGRVCSCRWLCASRRPCTRCACSRGRDKGFCGCMTHHTCPRGAACVADVGHRWEGRADERMDIRTSMGVCAGIPRGIVQLGSSPGG